MNFDKYVGIKYEDNNMDCGHLVELVLNQEFNKQITFPARSYTNFWNQSQQLESELDNYVEKVEEGQDGDILLMTSRGILFHVGVFFLHKNVPHVIHALKNVGSVCIHKVRDIKRLGLKVEGVYRLR